VAGLIKGILMLEKGKIPPHINFETPNPDIAFEKWKVKVCIDFVSSLLVNVTD
jgi:acyl transferase domain-containing protein